MAFDSRASDSQTAASVSAVTTKVALRELFGTRTGGTDDQDVVVVDLLRGLPSFGVRILSSELGRFEMSGRWIDDER